MHKNSMNINAYFLNYDECCINTDYLNCYNEGLDHKTSNCFVIFLYYTVVVCTFNFENENFNLFNVEKKTDIV